MVSSCCAVNCTNRFQKGNGRGFFKFPRNLSKKELWIKAVQRKNWVPSKTSLICGDHFQTGRPSRDQNHPDYVPNVFSFNKHNKGNAFLYEKRKKNIQHRNNSKKKKTEADGASVSTQVLQHLENKQIPSGDLCLEISQDVECPSFFFTASNISDNWNQEYAGDVSENTNQECPADLNLSQVSEDSHPQMSYDSGHLSADLEMAKEKNKILEKELEMAKEKNKILEKELEMAKEKNKILEKENSELKQELGSVDTAMEMHVLREEIRCLKSKLEEKNLTFKILTNGKLLKYYTSIAKIETFNWIHSVCKDSVKNVFRIDSRTQLLMVLIKLRLGLENKDLGIRFELSQTTISRIIDSWLPILSGRLKHLIKFPSHDEIKDTLPECFQTSKYSDTVCILDCTEIFTQRPANMNNKNLMWSNYKHHQTFKFLVGITPSGQISFISECWGGRVSDKEITLKCGIMAHFKPGDVVLADRGFNLKDEFALNGIRLILPSFTKGKTQLTKKEVLESKSISNIRIHVERVIGRLKSFKILKDIMPVTFFKHVNYAVTICAALVNLSPAIIN